ncbi:MAG: hypothetical protein GZ091_09960 [Paludibacter sp.]|nr:hypothetical protein [Paludibacter sp.]
MKNIIRILGITLIIGTSFVSCTKEVEVLEPTLLGTYKYKSVQVIVPIDTDGDGIANNDLMKEKGKECVWDNTWQYQENKTTLRAGEIVCESSEADNNNVIGSFNYTYSKTAKTIIITYEGGSLEVLKDVKIGYTKDQKQSLSFILWNNDLSQDVTYYLESN